MVYTQNLLLLKKKTYEKMKFFKSKTYFNE